MRWKTEAAKEMAPPAMPTLEVVAPTEEVVPTLSVVEPLVSPQLAAVELKEDKPVEAVNPVSDQKIGPWGIHRTSTGVVIDREFGPEAKRASGGVYFSIDDENYGTLHVLISAIPKAPEPAEEPTAEPITLEIPVSADTVVEGEK